MTCKKCENGKDINVVPEMKRRERCKGLHGVLRIKKVQNLEKKEKQESKKRVAPKDRNHPFRDVPGENKKK